MQFIIFGFDNELKRVSWNFIQGWESSIYQWDYLHFSLAFFSALFMSSGNVVAFASLNLSTHEFNFDISNFIVSCDTVIIHWND